MVSILRWLTCRSTGTRWSTKIPASGGTWNQAFAENRKVSAEKRMITARWTSSGKWEFSLYPSNFPHCQSNQCFRSLRSPRWLQASMSSFA